jgi:CubicO group peptidase (beta-lactamase class C family)
MEVFMMKLIEIVTESQKKVDFSGTILVRNAMEVFLEKSFGYANRAEKIENSAKTRFGIASGCKLFTAIAICQLVDQGKLSFDSKLSDCLEYEFPYFDEGVTIHHLLTHTSGVPDYFDEEVMNDFEELWIKNPMYHIRKLSDFLPLFQHQPMKSEVGEKFSYNNTGFILLGLVVEQISGMTFTDFVQKHIFEPAGMEESGYFSFDSLPSNTALGYIDFIDGTWKTNIYSLPVKGGSDGGAFVTANDMAKLWDALINNKLLNETTTNKLLTPHIQTKEINYYGYGVWIKKNTSGSILKYHVMGYDPGVSFHSAYYPDHSKVVVVCSNKSEGAFTIMSGIEEELLKVKI